VVMAIEAYLKDNIDNHVVIKPWQEINIFPVFLRDYYIFHEMTILGMQCILLEIINEMPGIETLQKHIKRIEALSSSWIVLYYKGASRYRRRSLIENHIPFVIEDGQMFLPFLSLDLNKAPQSFEKKPRHFSASAQITYLLFLYHKNEVMSATKFAEKVRCTLMTASRALRDLYNANLLTYDIGGKTGRSKEYKRISDPDYFLNGLDYVQSPIKKVVFTDKIPQGSIVAGLDALASLSMINPPDHPVRAIGLEQFNEQRIEIIKNEDLIKDKKLVELQIWDYDPKLCSGKQHVDLFSLFASLREENDERIRQALEEVLRGEPWYTA